MSSFTEVDWKLPGDNVGQREPSKNALLALQSVQMAVRGFDDSFELRNPEREASIPHFAADELVVGCSKVRSTGYFAEYEVKAIRIIMDMNRGQFGSSVVEARDRFADRCDEGNFYAAKFLQDGLIDSDHGPGAACDMIVETKILMNLAPHPNIAQVYGVNMEGIDSFLASGRRSFFFITDCIDKTLSERLNEWKSGEGYGREDLNEKKKEEKRLEIALDITTALVFLHDRSLVFYVRPEKVGFDSRYGRVKLCNFSQSRQAGMNDHARSITKSDDIKTLAYTAPEVLCKAPTTLSSDVYAIGIMLWEIISLSKPFEGYDRSTHFDDVVKCSQRPSIIPTWPKQVRDLIQECWHPHRRPSMKVVNESLEETLMFADDQTGPTLLDKAKEEYTATPKPTVERMRGPQSQQDGELHNRSDRSSSRRRTEKGATKSPARRRPSGSHAKRSSNSDGRKARSKTPVGQGRSKTPSGHGRSKTPRGEGRSKTPSGHGRAKTPSGHGRAKTPSGHGRSKVSSSGHGRSKRSKSPSTRLYKSSSAILFQQSVQGENTRPRSKSPSQRLGSSGSNLQVSQRSSSSGPGKQKANDVDGEHLVSSRKERKKSIQRSHSFNSSPRHSKPDLRQGMNKHQSLARLPPGSRRGKSTTDDKSIDSGGTGPTIADASISEESHSSPSPTKQATATSANQHSRDDNAEQWGSTTDAASFVRDPFDTEGGKPPTATKSPANRRKGLSKQSSSRRNLKNTHTPSTPVKEKAGPGFKGFSLRADPFQSPTSSGIPASPRKQSKSSRRLSSNGAVIKTKTPNSRRSNSLNKDMKATLEALRANFSAVGFDNIPQPSGSPTRPSLPGLEKSFSSQSNIDWNASAEFCVVEKEQKPASSGRRERSHSFVAGSSSASPADEHTRRKSAVGPPITRANRSGAKRRTSFA